MTDIQMEEGKPLMRDNGRIDGGEKTGRSEENGEVKVHSGRQEQDGVRGRRKSDSDSEVSLQSLDEYIPTPPDGGWGWVVVVASAIGNLIVDGIGYGFGVFLVPLVQAFDANKSQVSMVGSLLCGTYLFAGPIVSAMTNKFGCRTVVIAGSIIATTAFILASLSTSITMLIITYGVLGGFGLGMMYLPCIVMVGYYFEKRRAFATGLAVCGSGLGTFMFPPLSEFLLSQYNWSGGLLIIAGIIFNGCVCGALMRPLEAEPAKEKKIKKEIPREKNLLDRIKETAPGRTSEARGQKLSSTSATDSATSPSRDVTSGSSDPGTPKVIVETEAKTSAVRESKTNTTDPVDLSKKVTSQHSPDFVTPPSTNQNSPLKEIPETQALQGSHSEIREIEPSVKQSPKDPNHVNGIIHSSPSIAATNSNKKERISLGGGEHAVLLEVPHPSVAVGHNSSHQSSGSRNNLNHLSSMRSLHVSKKDLARPLYRKDIFYGGSVQNIPQYRSQPDMKSYITSITSIPGKSDITDGARGSSTCINSCCGFLPRPARDVLSEMVDLSLLKDVSFMLICLGNILTFLGFFIPFMFLVDRAIELEVDQNDAAFLISIIGITNTIGRVAIGKLADLRILDSLVITYISIYLCAAVTALVPFCKTYVLLAINAGLFGLGVAAFVSLSSIIICDRLGLDKLTNGFGLLSMVRGVGSMVGPPLAGAMYDSSGSYDLSFFLGGLLMCAGASCHVLLHLPCLRMKNKMDVMAMEEANTDKDKIDTVADLMGSLPQMVTLEDALQSVKDTSA